MIDFKKKIHQQLLKLLEDKLIQLTEAIDTSIKARDSETKSSAGDKYETGREMAQSEIDKLANNKISTKNLLNELKNLNPDTQNSIVTTGSLVETNHETFYLSISYGRMKVDHKEIYAISAYSPIGMALKAKKVGEKVNFNGKEYTITSVS